MLRVPGGMEPRKLKTKPTRKTWSIKAELFFGGLIGSCPRLYAATQVINIFKPQLRKCFGCRCAAYAGSTVYKYRFCFIQPGYFGFKVSAGIINVEGVA